jgi:hypothetical protein
MSLTELPIENALRWGYSRGYQYYPSGFGGLHGDGRYPGNTIENRNYPTWWRVLIVRLVGLRDWSHAKRKRALSFGTDRTEP